MKKLFILFLVCSAGYAYLNYDIPYLPRPPKHLKFPKLFKNKQNNNFISKTERFSDNDKLLKYAFDNKLRNKPSSGEGKIIKLLPDNFGRSKRQVFLVLLDSGQRLEVRHEINDQKRLPLKVGDYIEFNGIYNWHRDGGVVNKTNSDPKKGANGWIKHKGTTYN